MVLEQLGKRKRKTRILILLLTDNHFNNGYFLPMPLCFKIGYKDLLLQILIKNYRGFSNTVDQSDEFSFFRDIHVTNGSHLLFPKAYRHINRTAGAFRRVKSLET